MQNTNEKTRLAFSQRGRTLLILILFALMLPMLVLVSRQQQTLTQEAATTHQVSIKNFTMNPPTITVYVGDTITWTNQDNEAHDAAANDGSWSTPLLSTGESASVTFDEPGSYEYVCRPHRATMNGYKVIVLPEPSVQPTTATAVSVAPTATSTTQPSMQPTTVPSVAIVSPTLPQATLTPPSPAGTTTNLSLTLLLHGIGNAGDAANPSGNYQSNKNPQQIERLVRLVLINSSGQTMQEPTGTVTYNQATGDFRGMVSLGSNFPAGSYTVKLRMQNYLQRIIARNFVITNNAINTIPVAQLVAGDVDGSNTLDVSDYTAIIKCLSKDITGSACYSDEIKKVDLNDDGVITIADTNLLLREFSIRTGD